VIHNIGYVSLRKEDKTDMKAWEYLEQFEEKEQKKKSANTIRAYMTDLKQFKSYLKKDLELLTEDDINQYKLYLMNKRLKAKTINRKLISIRRFIEHLNSQDAFTDKIHIEIETIKIQRQEYLEDILTYNDYERLIRAAEKENDVRAIAVFSALYLTGMRVSELLQINVSNITDKTISVIGKGDKVRDIFIADQLIKNLNKYIKHRKHKEEDFLFLNENNDNPMSRQSVHRLIKKYAGKAKIKLTRAHAHGFRHLCGYRLIEKGMSLDEVADILGHADINTTRIYTRKTKKDLIKTINKLTE